MKNSLCFIAIAIALAVSASAAHAQKPVALHTTTPAVGMLLIGNGLYAQMETDGEAYVAFNADGRRALASRVTEQRQSLAKRYARDGVSVAEQARLDRLQRTIDELNAGSQDKGGYNLGPFSCGNGNVIAATTATTGGTSAYAKSVNALDYAITTPTLNQAVAWNEVETAATRVEYGSSAATASAYTPASCFAFAQATVTCPGTTVAAAYAVGWSHGSAPSCGN
jgi:opacity protein-like surface antigen